MENKWACSIAVFPDFALPSFCSGKLELGWGVAGGHKMDWECRELGAIKERKGTPCLSLCS